VADWESFYETTQEDLHPHGTCDCHRSQAFRYNTTIENHLFLHHRKCDISVAYVQVFGSKPIGGHWGVSRHHRYAMQAQNVSRYSDEVFEEAMPSFEHGSWVDVISKHIKPLRPTALVLTSAWWEVLGASFFDDLRSTAAGASECVIWKTSTQIGPWNQKDFSKGDRADKQARAAFTRDVIFEAAAATKHLNATRLWWDVGGIHFTAESGAYRALNLALLDLVTQKCPRPSTSAAPDTQSARGWATGWS